MTLLDDDADAVCRVWMVMLVGGGRDNKGATITLSSTVERVPSGWLEDVRAALRMLLRSLKCDWSRGYWRVSEMS